jgi:hypothetical protein
MRAREAYLWPSALTPGMDDVSVLAARVFLDSLSGPPLQLAVTPCEESRGGVLVVFLSGCGSVLVDATVGSGHKCKESSP